MASNTFDREAQYAWDRLVAALLRLDCLKTELNGNELRIFEPECKGLFYDVETHLVVIAVDRDQLQPDRIGELDRSKGRAILRGNMGSGTEVIPVNGTFYFAIPLEELERVAA